MVSYNIQTFALSVFMMQVIPDYKSLTALRSHHPTNAITTNNAATFPLDRSRTQCVLEVDTYQVMKVAERNEGALRGEKDEFNFYAILGNTFRIIPTNPKERRYENQIGYVTCKYGWIDFVFVHISARGCGLGTIFTELCMIDPDLNANTQQNLVFKRLRRGGRTDEKQQAISHLESNCHGGLIGLHNAAQPLNGKHHGAFAYLSAAKRMGYQYMVVQHYDTTLQRCGNNVKFYKIEDAQSLYDEHTGRINDDEGSGYEAKWYFCRELVRVKNFFPK